ncbi:hypothetical protein [Paraburkholderia sp. RL17-347-BIC-D]|uniref:hypothetical protein n=1 Tax=Paraburkholderia sp. RL17-347-BIC-D TaxID=3031632 RepID=UPI0038BE0559
MTASELIEILREVDPKSRVVFLAGGLHAEVAEEIVAVATPEWVWVRGSFSDEECEDETQHASEQGADSGTRRERFESKPVSIVLLSTDEDFLFKAIVKKLMLG